MACSRRRGGRSCHSVIWVLRDGHGPVNRWMLTTWGTMGQSNQPWTVGYLPCSSCLPTLLLYFRLGQIRCCCYGPNSYPIVKPYAGASRRRVRIVAYHVSCTPRSGLCFSVVYLWVRRIPTFEMAPLRRKHELWSSLCVVSASITILQIASADLKMLSGRTPYEYAYQ